ncbi:B12-binding domain-containing radical SAM protein [Pelagibacteraceae bacterium]|nr:B12-binding domain-containing radical SAM protein [Pelagibacteraceae bacterium]
METVICSVPVESPGAKLRRKRSEGPIPVMPKVAIASLNNWAERNNLPTCKFYDIDMLYPSDEEIENWFKKNKADVVGLSAVVSTSYLQVKRLAKIIKKANQNTLIVCGGYLTAAANTVLRKTEVDVCVVGDGEKAWVGLLKHMTEHIISGKNKLDIDKLLEVQGIAIVDENKKLRFSGYGKKLQSCDMTFPDMKYLKSGLQGHDEAFNNYFRTFHNHDSFIMDDRSWEKGRRPMVTNIFTTKGCVARCTFCQRGSKGYYTYDLDKLEEYIKVLANEYNVGFIYIPDENFGSNKKFTYQVAELMNKYNMLWSAIGIRVNSVEKKDLEFYKKNGCSLLQFGIESGSQTMLDIMEKKFTVEDIKKALFACYDIGLNSLPTGFMLGMPGETEKTVKESAKLMGELCAKLRISPKLIWKYNDLMYCIPLVGTPMYEYGKQFGLIGQSVDEEEQYLESTSNVGAYKRSYVNFNGAPMSEVVFWDILFHLESTRVYHKLMKGKKENEDWKKKYKQRLDIQSVNPTVKSKQKNVQIMGAAGELNVSINQNFITNRIKDQVVFNKFIAKLPRFVVYPVVKYLLYFEYIIQKYFLKNSYNIHKVAEITNQKVNSKIRIKAEEVDPTKTTTKDRSLRTIVEKREKRIKRTEQEKLISTLTVGA